MLCVLQNKAVFLSFSNHGDNDGLVPKMVFKGYLIVVFKCWIHSVLNKVFVIIIYYYQRVMNGMEFTIVVVACVTFKAFRSSTTRPSISGSLGWITTIICIHVHDSQRMNPREQTDCCFFCNQIFIKLSYKICIDTIRQHKLHNNIILWQPPLHRSACNIE